MSNTREESRQNRIFYVKCVIGAWGYSAEEAADNLYAALKEDGYFDVETINSEECLVCHNWGHICAYHQQMFEVNAKGEPYPVERPKRQLSKAECDRKHKSKGKGEYRSLSKIDDREENK